MYTYLVYNIFMSKIYNVILSSKAEKQIKKLPSYIVIKLMSWVDAVVNDGISAVRKVTGYHDEHLLGQRAGQRSIRLSKSYRAIYIEMSDNKLKFIEIIEVNKHEY